MKYFCSLITIIFFFSCNSTPGTPHTASPRDTAFRQNKEENAGKAYKFRLDPVDRATYRYALNNNSEITMNVNGNETSSINNAEAVTSYTVNRDSSGDFIFNIRYDKIKIHTQKGGVETNADADNGALSANPVEKMLGILKQSAITAIVGLNGEIKEIKGYKELGDKLTGGFAANDVYAKNAARSQWEKLIGGNIFRGGVDKLFTVLPDSTIKPGDSWTATATQAGEFPVNIKSTYTLKEIRNDVAVIRSVGDITSIDIPSGAPELGNIKGNIKGKQKGTVTLNIKTGMIVSNDITTGMEGTIQTMGVDVPVSIQNVVKIRQLK
ncbi:MAG: hypothetical protein KF862_08650 [Chitinophagaceae bacterium]|nr:hypothetical protein [Chitinophagaceae bacterium]